MILLISQVKHSCPPICSAYKSWHNPLFSVSFLLIYLSILTLNYLLNQYPQFHPQYHSFNSRSLFVCLFIYGCIGSSLLHVGFFSNCGEQGPLFVAVRGLLIAAASLVAEHRL